MKNIVVVGSQWGDEGKGKIVDWLSDQADVVVRFQGGHNAGHTLVIDGKVFKLRLLPSGIVRKEKISILGNGVVIDPWALLSEIKDIKKQGVEVTPDNFMISESASLILPFHREMDEIREDAAGKGKIVDWLSDQADIVVRFQGGHNAGHTLVIDGKVFKLRLLPSGIVRKEKISILGNGVVIAPWALLDEIKDIKKKGVEVTPDNFMISETASLILPFHREMDEIREDAAGKEKIGTTRRGIGPCYEDKVGRRSIRVVPIFSLPAASSLISSISL